MDPHAMTDELTKPFPPAAIKTRQGGGGSSLSYVEGETVIRRLIAATGNRFDVKVLNIDAKSAGQTRQGDPQTLLIATVELCIPGLGCRQHIGVQLTTEKGGEDLAKGCVTDAIKKAATLFGVGLELYGPDYEGNGYQQPTLQQEALEADYLEAIKQAKTAKELAEVKSHMQRDKINTQRLRDAYTAKGRALGAGQ